MDLLALVALALSIVALVVARRARDVAEQFAEDAAALRAELRRLSASVHPPAPREERHPSPAVPGPPPLPVTPRIIAPEVPMPGAAFETRVESSDPAPAPAGPGRIPQPGRTEPEGLTPPAEEIRAEVPAPSPIRKLPINWEMFMGAKLFAWIGGLALFLGVGFFVKYSFEHNLIPPEMRVAIGFVTGIGLLAGGLGIKRPSLAVIAQTLCATGILILYAVTFACRAVYQFPFFGVMPTFLLMTLITAVAFVLAVRLDAQVVAVLGILGGFVTPVLLSTGQDNPWGLFGYIALLDLGLLAVALHRHWNYLVPLGAIGTACLQIGWATTFFSAGKYFEGNKILIPMAVLAGFVALFVGAVFWARRRDQLSLKLSSSALGLACIAFCFAFFFLAFPPLGARPLLLFSFVFLIDLGVLALVLLDGRLAIAQPISGIVAFLLAAVWTAAHVTDALLNSALAIYFVFTVFHTVAPLMLHRMRKSAPPAWWSQLFPALALVLALAPLLRTTELSFLVWPFVFLIDVLAIVISVLLSVLLPILVVLVLTLVVAAVWVFQVPAELTGLPTSLWIIGAFAIFFAAVSVWAVCRMTGASSATDPAGEKPAATALSSVQAQVQSLLPACSAVLPFLLLIMVTARLPIANPSPVFGLALLLIVLLLGITRLLAVDVLPLVGLVAVLALEHAWHFARFDPSDAAIPLTWYFLFYALFTVFPFVFRANFKGRTLPWVAAALSGPLHFYLIHRLILAAYPNPMMGLLPAAFTVPSIFALIALLKSPPATTAARDSQIALFGGVALFFITLIFPIQFDRQWITIGWAVEGTALCWLFRRVAHPGLRITGVALLVVAFARLALNPAVLSYHARSPVAIFNWYLYAYGAVTAALFAGAAFLAPPRHLLFGKCAPPVLMALGTILAFLLVNVEIADYFTEAGAPVVTLEFSGNLARDMTYSVAWALFALMLVSAGIARKLPPVRYAGIGLLSITLLKLFFHDLSQLEALYRIGALIGVAVVAMLASFLYQRFLSTGDKAP